MVSFSSSGRDYTVVNVSLTDAFANVNITRAATSFSIQVRNDSRVIWRRSATETDEWTLKEGQVYSVDGSIGTEDGETKTIGQAKIETAGGTDTLEIWLWYG